jgi:hypothetical protein
MRGNEVLSFLALPGNVYKRSVQSKERKHTTCLLHRPTGQTTPLGRPPFYFHFQPPFSAAFTSSTKDRSRLLSDSSTKVGPPRSAVTLISIRLANSRRDIISPGGALLILASILSDARRSRLTIRSITRPIIPSEIAEVYNDAFADGVKVRA